MSHLHSTTKPVRKKYAHLTYSERQKLEGLVQLNRKLPKKRQLRQYQMALALECGTATISRELTRGRVELLGYDGGFYVSYSADIAQRDYDFQATGKGPDLKLTDDQDFIEHVEERILKKWSPDAIIMDLDKKQGGGFQTKVCTSTLYRYIQMGLFLNITNQELPRKGQQAKRKYRKVRRALKCVGAPLITERPVQSTERLEPGHWEMDCIVSGAGKGREALLTLNDRCIRECLIIKLKAQTQDQVIRALDKIERSMGRKAFCERFKTITVDNGSEFLNWKGIERSVTGTRKKRTQIYFCHPYSSFERGTNEQNNGVIRYFIPKGAAIKDYSRQQIQSIQDHLNNYPRRILKGLSANEAKENHRMGVPAAAAASIDQPTQIPVA